MLEIVYGSTANAQQVSDLISGLETMGITGTLYIGYPIVASADGAVTVEALLTCLEHGLVAFTLSATPPPGDHDSWVELKEKQDSLYFALQASLGRHQGLRKERELGVPINVVSFLPTMVTPHEDFHGSLADRNSVAAVVREFPALPAEFVRPLNASLQRVTAIKPVKIRTAATTNGSKGAALKKLEREIANLDQWQKRAAIESPEGPQRIRGLAGSGKTVVLALKAAYLHAQHPDWDIAVTFYSRSLYQQFTDLIRRFSYEHTGGEPDWRKLKLLHAWGGTHRAGVYTEIAAALRAIPRDWLYGRTKFGSETALGGICGELLAMANGGGMEPIYDAVLIDEAQDLPKSFLQLVYAAVRNPKRIIWAYDELQNLSDTAMPSVSEMFGVKANGEALVTLRNESGRPRQDIILPVCYRNTPWALTLAHSLGFGIYREGGLVQHFDEPSLWREIGYSVEAGELAFGQKVSLRRSTDSYPPYFENLLQPETAVNAMKFAGRADQTEWVASSVKKNLTEDDLEYDDILIILPNSATAKSYASEVIDALRRKGIDGHLAGVTTSQDQMFATQSVAISNIHRAKGNEAAMVYLLDAQFCVQGYESIKRRNTLFTAITRSRAWVNICGWGPTMDSLALEIDRVGKADFQLNFCVPLAAEIQKMRIIHRDRTAGEKQSIKDAERGIKDLIKALDQGAMEVENIPPELRQQLLRRLGAGDAAKHSIDPE